MVRRVSHFPIANDQPLSESISLPIFGKSTSHTGHRERVRLRRVSLVTNTFMARSEILRLLRTVASAPFHLVADLERPTPRNRRRRRSNSRNQGTT